MYCKEIHQATPESHILGHQEVDERGDSHTLHDVELSRERETSCRLEIIMEIYGARCKRLEESVGHGLTCHIGTKRFD